MFNFLGETVILRVFVIIVFSVLLINNKIWKFLLFRILIKIYLYLK